MASLKDLGNSLQGFFSNAGKAVGSALPQVGQAVWNATPIGQVQQLQKLAPQVQSFIQKYPSPASYIGQNIIQPAINQMKINNERSLTPVQKAMPSIQNNPILQNEARNIGEGLKSVWDLGPGMASNMLKVPFASDPQAAYRQAVQDIPGNAFKGIGLAFKAAAPLMQYGYQLGMAPIKGALQSHRTGESFGKATENAVINQPGLGTAAFGEGPKAMLGNVGEFLAPFGIDAGKAGIKNFNAQRTIGNVLKEGEAMGFNGLSPRAFQIHPEDQKILTDIIGKSQAGIKNTPEELKTLDLLAQHYLGQKYEVGSTDKIMKTFDWVLAKKNGGLPIGNLPKPAYLNSTSNANIPQELQPLANEASKYKSAKEFYLRMGDDTRDLLKKNNVRGEESITDFWNKYAIKKEPILNDLNPTGGLLVDYDPKSRMKMKLGPNMTTLDKTMNLNPNETITIYRGVSKEFNQKSINPGDFITTNYDLAKSYSGDGNVLSLKVKASDVLDDISEPLGDEYLYRPGAADEINKLKKTIPQPSPSGLSMGIVGKNNTFQEPYARGDISNLSKKLDEILGTKEFMMTGKYTDVFPARQKAMQQLEHYASQGDEGALKAYEIAQDLENELAKATNAKNGWKQPLTKLPQPESLQPMAKLPQVGEMAPLAPEVQNTQFPKTGTVPTQAALKSKPTGFEAEMDALAAQTKPTITTIGKKKPLPKMAGSDAEKLAEKAQLNAEGNKKGFQKIFSDLIGERNAAQTKGVQVGSKIRILPANPEEVIKAIENPGMKVSPETEKYIAQFRALDDEVFAQAKKLGLDINYLKEHIAHFWKQDPQEVQQAYAVFKQKYGLTERRVIPTYEEGIKIGLTPKFTSPAQILAESVKKLEETKAGIKAFESLKEQGFIVPASVGSKNPGFVPISAPGFPRNATQINDQLGTVGNWYAPKAVADQINRVFSPQDFGPLGSMLDKAAGLSGKIQDLGLSGGLPGTPMNAFGAAQVTKETLAGRGIQGVTSFIRSFSDTATRNYFEKNSQQLIKMQERNIPISTNFSINDLAGDGIGSNVSSAINNLIKGQFGPAKDAIGSIWQKAMNEPTFKRFMPQLQVELFNDIERSALKQGKSANEAADIAAQAVKNFYGSTGSDVAARAQGIHDPLVQKTLSTLTFAPKFRESMINFWVNNIKALKNPTALENRANITFVGGAIATYIAMDKINYALNGKHLNENPPGTEDKLLIPTGNGDVIGVPFLSSIATIPRALYREGKMVVSGDIKGAAKDAFQSYASMMIKPIADVVSNADYFGKKIYNEEDKPQEKFAAQAKYLVSQLAIHPYLKELFTPSKQDDPIYQRLSRSMELPLKFYTNASLNSKYYYSERDKAVGGLSDQEKSALAAIPKADSEDPNTRILKYQTYLTYPKVFDAKQKIELEMAAKTGKAIDPLYLVNYDVAKKYMRYETLPEGSQDRKEMTKAYPELLGLFQARSKYFTENPYPGSGSGSSRPVPSPAVQQAMNNQNWTAPGVREYLDANTAYNNAQREKLGLPPLAGYTQYAKKPKKVKIIKAKAMKTPKIGKTKVANFKIAKPKKIKVTKSKPITYRSIMSKA